MTSTGAWPRMADGYWDIHLKGPPIKPLAKPCGDCAVECGFYSPVTDALALEPRKVQVEVSLRWYCHNNPRRACRGNWNRLKIQEAEVEE